MALEIEIYGSGYNVRIYKGLGEEEDDRSIDTLCVYNVMLIYELSRLDLS